MHSAHTRNHMHIKIDAGICIDHHPRVANISSLATQIALLATRTLGATIT